ncbi:hypothetical protein [Desulforegula conservatrix]|uniref:hypothetical protein n=1 Tax=Desulforegula conservatrix TaxID=153026 RepID=UPI0003FC157B|nr:hypothetical protein [Desulforegula conservatrix]
MATTISEVKNAFEILFTGLCNKSFSKSLYLEHWGEKALLPLVRTFLLGYFGHNIEPEKQATLPGGLTGKGKIDFLIDDVAVEFAVRTPNSGANTLSRRINEDEIKKLLKFDGKALLVLFDFSKKPFSAEELEAFRSHPSLGKGNHKKTPFQISYFFKDSEKTTGHIKKQIRARKRKSTDPVKSEPQSIPLESPDSMQYENYIQADQDNQL